MMPKPTKPAALVSAPIDSSAFLTIPEAAARLRVHERTVWRLVKAKKIHVHRFGRSTRIAVTELERYITECAA
jgi:excisionase family DNA binding protein